MQYELSTAYEGANLKLLANDGRVRLLINGIERDSAEIPEQGTVRLSSTVQTGYEWHEFVEGLLTLASSEVSGKIIANSQELVAQTDKRE